MVIQGKNVLNIEAKIEHKMSHKIICQLDFSFNITINMINSVKAAI